MPARTPWTAEPMRPCGRSNPSAFGGESRSWARPSRRMRAAMTRHARADRSGCVRTSREQAHPWQGMRACVPRDGRPDKHDARTHTADAVRSRRDMRSPISRHARADRQGARTRPRHARRCLPTAQDARCFTFTRRIDVTDGQRPNQRLRLRSDPICHDATQARAILHCLEFVRERHELMDRRPRVTADDRLRSGVQLAFKPVVLTARQRSAETSSASTPLFTAGVVAGWDRV
jgi:hypothetical protein